MSPAIHPYTVTNSYKGGLFMRTYGRNVRRAWDGDDYRQPKRQRTGAYLSAPASSLPSQAKENNPYDVDLEDNLERAIRETSIAALSSSPSRKNSTVFSLNESHDDDDDDGSNTITPPSSPPHALQLTPPNVKIRKPIFKSMNKQRKDKTVEEGKMSKLRPDLYAPLDQTRHDNITEPLTEIPNSSSKSAITNPTSRDQHTPENPSRPEDAMNATTAKPAQPKQNLVQTVLDLGQSLTPLTCSNCQMSYVPSVPEDAQLHNMWHNRNESGIELGKPFLKSAMKWCYEVSHIPGSVVVVDRKISVPGRRAVQRALEVVNKDLGSVDIKEDELWSQRTLDGDDEESGRKCDRYKAFLHIIDGKCVGLCLAVRISKAHRVLPSQADSTPVASQQMQLNKQQHIQQPPSPPMSEDLSVSMANAPKSQSDDRPGLESKTDSNTGKGMSLITPQPSYTFERDNSTFQSSSITISDETYPVIVGVSRIWTSKKFRRRGIANNLLECVMNQFIYGMDIARTEIAFSQPTESGCQLARQWFGVDHGWSVYRED